MAPQIERVSQRWGVRFVVKPLEAEVRLLGDFGGCVIAGHYSYDYGIAVSSRPKIVADLDAAP